MLGNAEQPLSSYLRRRIVRLWLPYACSILFAALLVSVIGTQKLPGQSEWLNELLGNYPTAAMILAHLLMIGDFDTKTLNFVVWSLVVEMRMSLVFPLVHRMVMSASPLLAGAVAIGTAGAAAFVQHAAHAGSNSPVVTLRYLPCFVGGALLSRHAAAVALFYRSLGRPAKLLLLCASLLLYGGWLPTPFLESATVGSLGLLVLATSSGTARRALQLPWVQTLGSRSYSLYLTHAVVLIALVNLLASSTAYPAIVLAAIPAIAVITELAYRLVERPAMAWSRRLGSSVRAPSG